MFRSPRLFAVAGLAIGLMLTLVLSLAPSHASAAIQGVWAAGLGDDEVCGDGVYLGRIVTSGGYAVGDQITVGSFTIQVTSVKDGGEITGFIVIAGAYDYIVIHAGDGQPTFSDPTGPFPNGLSFVAFCGALTIPTSTNTPVPPTETPTSIPTETPTSIPTETPTETPGITPTVGGVTEVPSETPGITPTVGGVTEVPTETPEATPTTDTTTSTPVVDPTATPTEDDIVGPGGLPDTGSGPGRHGTEWVAALMALVSAFAGLSWFFRRLTAWD